jgi:MFS family permease
MVRPDERTALMGAVNVARSIACSFGPLVTGALAGGGQWAWAFYLCGGLKLTYDGLLLLTARHLKVDA